MGKERPKMPMSQRAKIFMPFAALKGYDEAIAAKEKEIYPRPELSEDQTEMLNRVISQIKEGDSLKITYYNGERCQRCSGNAQKVDKKAKVLILDTISIAFCDLVEIDILKALRDCMVSVDI